MRDKLVELLEGSRIEQQADPFAGRELAGLVLAAKPLVAAAKFRPPLEIFEMFQNVHQIGSV